MPAITPEGTEMQAAPSPAQWESPIEYVILSAWLGTDGQWHLTVDQPGGNVLITACGADLAPGVKAGTNWTNDTSRVDCPPCTASEWAAVAATRA
jgi:hypothetical protein